MGLEVLVPILMGALLKVAVKAGEGVLGAVEQTTTDVASGVFSKLKTWWSSDPSANEELSKFEQEPEIYAPVIEARLAKKLADNPDKRTEFTTALQGADPQVEVFQDIAWAHGITGARIEKLLGGQVRVDQKIEEASDAIGVDIKTMGGPSV